MGGKRKRTWVIPVVILAVLLAGGAVAGIVTWKVVSSNRLVAEVQSVELERTDGKDLDLEKVPLDTEVALVVGFRVRYREGGKAALKASVVDSEGNEIAKKTWKVKSSKELQEERLKYSMEEGSGKPIEARAELEVTFGEKKEKGEGSLSYKSVAGKGKRLRLKDAKDLATAKMQEAINATNEIIGMGIDASDLVARMDEGVKKLEAAKTEEEANSVYAEAEAIMGECASRKAAFIAQQNRQQDIENCRGVMYNYAYAEKGNCEDVWWVDFSMNDAGTQASGTIEGMVTVHTDPDRAGQHTFFYLTAAKQDGQWVITGYRYEHVL